MNSGWNSEGNRNPYDVIGVAPTATDDEVKKAYRNLARKYHPDVYQGNPLSDVAQEKMQEINTAYDTIVRQRKQGYYPEGRTASNGGAGGQYNKDYYGQAEYSQRQNTSRDGYATGRQDYGYIRQLIVMGRISDAETLLNGIGTQDRNAEWNYLKGLIHQKKGWLEEAYRQFFIANQMDPSNKEYKQVLDMVQRQRANERYGSGNKSPSNTDMCGGSRPYRRSGGGDCSSTCCDGLMCCACMNMCDCCM